MSLHTTISNLQLRVQASNARGMPDHASLDSLKLIINLAVSETNPKAYFQARVQGHSIVCTNFHPMTLRTILASTSNHYQAAAIIYELWRQGEPLK